MKYLFVLDFGDGKVYRYNLIDAEVYVKERGFKAAASDYEDFIIERGHSLSNCEWMTTNSGKLYTYMDAD